jgi:nicotinate-nucleotide pyrophosphorylase (carboxylating)
MTGVNSMLRDAGLDPVYVAEICQRALEEDLAGGVDVTSVATVPMNQRSEMQFIAHASGVVAGLPVAAQTFLLAEDDADLDIAFPLHDGDNVDPGDVVLVVNGPTHVLLRAERPALNLLGRLSGIATLTNAWVSAITQTGAVIRDTRKTTPGLRALEKYAVRCGGGVNHRMSLSDAALVKDNHIVAAGGVSEAFAAVRREFPDLSIEVEVDDLGQLNEVLHAGADLVLLDNFTLDQLREAVQVTSGRAKLEASGGLTLDNARAVAETGVNYLAVGALTHSAPVLDIGADLVEEGSHAARN